MIFGLTFEKLVVIGVIAALLLGPDRLPGYAAKFARLLQRGKELMGSAKTRMQDELGDDVDWRSLDPRQYDPRRIIREALLDDDATVAPRTMEPAPVPRPQASAQPFVPGAIPPFDTEAT